MGDLISREQAIDAMGCLNDSICEQQAVDALWELPSVEKTGKWTVQFADNGWIDHICSECGFRHNTDIHIFLDWRYCPSCGAVMEEEKGQWEI